jgi:hypothetical protein
MERIKNVTISLDAGFGEFRKDVGSFLETVQSALAQAQKTLAMKEGPPCPLDGQAGGDDQDRRRFRIALVGCPSTQPSKFYVLTPISFQE